MSHVRGNRGGQCRSTTPMAMQPGNRLGPYEVNASYRPETHLGKQALARQMALQRQNKLFTTDFVLSDGAMCNTQDKKCYVRDGSNQVHQKYTSQLYTPCCAPPVLAPSTRRPPTSTVTSGAVSVSICDFSTSSTSAGTVDTQGPWLESGHSFSRL